MGPGWIGTCDRLSSITKPTLIITGTDEVTSPPANSLVLAEKILEAWLVQIKGGGHVVMYQYPDKYITVFLETIVNNRILLAKLLKEIEFISNYKLISNYI